MKKAKYFTIDEANQMIPALVPILQQLRTLRVEIDKLEVGIDALELIQEKDVDEGEVGDELKLKMKDLERFIHMMNEKIQEIEARGCFLKSIELGLVDFLSQREDRPVYLCWSLGEETVSYWHEIGQGFANRHPLT